MSLPLVSLHPPSHGGDVDLADAPRPDWVLLDFRAYVDSCTNATTASCKARDGLNDIQVTFFPAQPPRVSHFCVYCPGLGPYCFGEEPRIIATDGKFVLLRIFIGRRHDILCHNLHEYYIYCADGGTDGGPSLQLIPHPSPYNFHDGQVGLVSRGTSYTIAILRDDSSAFFRGFSNMGKYDVCLFNSEDKIWRAIPVSVPYEEECQEECSDDDEGFVHETTKVITVGGEHGTIAFVDLWRGILLYDVFRQVPVLRYIPLPGMFRPSPTPNATPSVTRDIAFVKGCIRIVHTVMKIKSATRVFGDYVSGGWVASKWSIKAPFDDNSCWTEDCTIDASDIFPASLELLKDLPGKGGKPCETLETFHTGHPTLSLDDDGIVYFMAKVKQQEKKAWILAVDMNHRMLLQISAFGAERTFGLSYTYTQSRISKYLNMTPGTKGDLKRPGMPLPGLCNKKLSGISSVACREAEDDV
ncbi:hypothetical protein PR202_ga23272 [Eleusine coracana subsp. coracana]|uniref:DUF1618 domain-containing protein n=1 Tax=Eleusine coracana subsp. coracana TaxID=191504 RepID=A0AAV5D5T1_ELECO|nr:hypothetical protein QOZ80_1AG0012040 [Eleusine coracana subsp. coracana]GJN05625.1 hypothetical protein PR202_ga23272 [Eleusine coracana subsp. coracana]